MLWENVEMMGQMLEKKYSFDPYKERVRGLFDEVLVGFMRQKSNSNCIRPLPALCGAHGRPVDLFKLFSVVRSIGGHDAVSSNNLWGFVSEECGLGLGVVSSVKLIHKKYLNELDRWLMQVVGDGELVRKLDLLGRELEIRLADLSPDEMGQRDIKDSVHIVLDNSVRVENNTMYFVNDDEKSRVGCDHSDEHMIGEMRGDIDRSINEFGTSAKTVVKKAVAKRVVKNAVEKVMNEANGFSKGQFDDDIKKSYSGDDDNTIASAKKFVEKVINKVLNCENDSDVSVSTKNLVKKVINKTDDLSENDIADDERVGVQQGTDDMSRAKSDVENVVESHKRKRESRSFSGMVNWLKHVAKLPDDPSVGLVPECSKWGEYGNEELWVQAMLAREAVLIRRQPNTNLGGNLLKDQQKKPRMHPSMYEDDVRDHQSTENLRGSKRVSMAKSHLCPCCNSNASPQSKNTVHQETNKGNSVKSPVKSVVTDVEEPPKKLNNPNSSDVTVEKQVPVGPLFQAEVPQWPGVITESDSKWLGSRMWPLQDDNENPMARLDHVGKGRDISCDCPFPNSVECVRLHVAEKRQKLRREIGLLFHHWRFDRMGEEVSLSWTQEEENKFKDIMMRSYATFPNKFWDNASRFLPLKTREKLVSYYFNVFLVQRRSYQNRVTPKDVDSDNDEKACGSIGGRFGYKAVHVRGSSIGSCTLNKESDEFV